jgi:uncharacterized protein YfaQ (DUF2300 family)
MSEDLVVPAFASEAEEAEWWYANREDHAAKFSQALADGRVKVNDAARRLAAAQNLMTLHLDKEEITKARSLAERRGMEVASYLKLLVQQALERESQGA